MRSKWIVFILAGCVCALICISEFKNFLCQQLADIFFKVTVYEMENMYISLGYRNDAGKSNNVAAAFIENVNSSNIYYGLMEENEEVTLVRYEGNLDVKDKWEKKDSEENKDEVVAAINEFDGVTRLGDEYSGRVYTKSELSDFNFLMSNFYVVPSRAKVLESELDANTLLGMDMSMKNENSKPQILIYHTHSMEGFTDSTDGNFSTNIVKVGEELSKLLSKGYGYNVIHLKETFDYVNGKLDRSMAYTYARERLIKILEDNPSIEVVIDIHRDGVRDDLHLVTEVNGKPTAKIMFFNGVSRTSAGGDIGYLHNKNKMANLSFSLQLKLLAEKYYPDFTRKNYIDAYQYNLDLREKSVLIEVGAQTNSLSEAVNAMEPLAALLDKLFSMS